MNLIEFKPAKVWDEARVFWSPRTSEQGEKQKEIRFWGN
jgi:hypothetical protein